MGRVRFSDVVKRVNVFVDREHTDLLYYVGGEHIDSDAFMVRKNGLIKGATIGYKFHFGFQPGHILFMSRNPHLRKCSMVDFAGVCSDSTYVVETRDENVLLQRYLLIEMQSDRFWKWAEENKSGSVNYLINYCTLDSYEFDLPPIEEQRALAEKLWAANDLKEKYQHLLAATDEMLKAKFREMFGEFGVRNAECGVRLGDCLNNIRYGASQPPDFVRNAPVKFVRATNINRGSICEKEMLTITDEAAMRLEKCRLQGGEIIIVRSGANAGDSCYVPVDYSGSCAGYDIIINVDEKRVAPQWLAFLLVIPEYFECHIKPLTNRTAQPHINAEQVKSLPIGFSGANDSVLRIPYSAFALPPIGLQREFVAIADAAEASKAELKKSIASIDAVIKGLING